MAPAARPIPAWKRLGLTLASDAHAAAPAPALAPARNSPFPPVAHSIAVPAEKGQSAGLGKRKHLHFEAEHDEHAHKKTRTAAEPDHSGTRVEIEQPAALPAAPAEKPAFKGGDPNYRQRKTKGPATTWKAQKVVAPKPVAPKPVAAKAPPPPAVPAPPPAESHVHSDRAALLPSTESHTPAFTPAAALRKSNKILHSTPPRTGRRKSVTFTPDTKTLDGDSAYNYFKKWVAERKGAQADFSAAEVAQFNPPPKVHPANGVPAPISVKKLDQKPAANAGAPDAKGRKKDPTLYLAYLEQFHTDNGNWKFNKARQNDVLDNALNIFRIPDSHSEALAAYVKGLQGGGVIQRLQEKCKAALKEIDEEDRKDPMADEDARKIAKAEALEERLAKEQKRRRLTADLEGLTNHPHPDGFIRRLKRHRAEALLGSLGLAVPVSPAPVIIQPQEAADPLPGARVPRKRKSRTDVSSDESSSDSSSDDDSSDSDSDDESGSSDSGPADGKSSKSGNGSEGDDSSDESASSGSGSGSGSESGSESSDGENVSEKKASSSSDSDSDSE